jgi:mannobiose 2-epimerase
MFSRFVGWLTLACACVRLTAAPAGFAAAAADWRQQLGATVLPYWFDTAVDWARGGYVLADDAVTGRGTPDEKQVVTQARMVWGFARAHRAGFSTPQRDYLRAAAHGVQFLRAHLRDREHGGYFWSVTLTGEPRDPRKRLYGEAFVLYGLVEFYRASGEAAALADALALFHELQTHAHDAKHGGWQEHFERDWRPLPPHSPHAIVEVAGYKSANTHLHLMEAFTELYAETKDPAVRRALVEALKLNRTYFYPRSAAKSAFHFQADWKPVTEAASAGLSYGHNVEFAWLMLRAEATLGRRPSWTHFHHYLQHTLRGGTDRERGGIYNRGVGDAPAHDRLKVWWAQAEMLAALTDGLRHQPDNAAYAAALTKLIHWCNTAQTDPKTGVWLDTVTATGAPHAPGRAHNWKANYHDVRALLKFVEQFETRPGQ